MIFLPGSAAVRPIIRGMPYLASLGYLLWCLGTRSYRALTLTGKLALLALAVYAVNLGHPLTDLRLGVAVVLFHLAIMAPIVWAGPLVQDASSLRRLLWVFLLASMAHVIVGLLQAAFPVVFMPAEFRALPAVLAEQTYRVPFGQEIVRLPGLTDLPAGASEAGTLAAILGLAFAVGRGERPLKRAFALFALASGLFVLYLTQVRSLVIVVAFALVLLAGIAFWQGRSRRILAMGAGLAALALPVLLRRQSFDPGNPYAPGGHFQELLERGLFSAYMENRGVFLRRTFGELLEQYPFGAGLGRWGTMRQYFGRDTQLEEIWVEIQPTGWLLDGGVPIWIFYGGAVAVALLYSLRLAVRRSEGDLSYYAAVVLSMQFAIVLAGMGGAVFNTILGITFWLLTAVLDRAAEIEQREAARILAARTA